MKEPVILESFAPDLDGTQMRIGIVQSRFNENITQALRTACIRELLRLGVLQEDLFWVSVAGALEIPLALQKMIETDQFDALIALGAVVRGETYHFELVADQSAAGVMRVSLDAGIPVANGILTTENEQQALARAEQKAVDVARVAIEMVNFAGMLDAFSDALDKDEE